MSMLIRGQTKIENVDTYFGKEEVFKFFFEKSGGEGGASTKG